MPKRKALGPVDSSDGEEDAFYSFPNTPMQSPFPKLIPNNFHSSSTPKRLPPASTLTTFSLSSNSSGTQLQTLAATSGLQNKSSMFALSTNQISSVPPAPLVAKKPRSSEFTKSMRDLNNAFISSCRATISKNPTHSLVPLVKDYLHHSRVLMENSRGKTVGGNGPTNKLVNGITSSPPTSFKTLGEFFDDFERNFIESTAKDDKSESGKESNLNTSGAITNSNSLSAFLSSGKINNNFGLTMSSPKPASENFKAFGSSETVTASSSSSTPSETTSLKTSMFMSSPSPAKVSTLTDINKSNTSTVLSPAVNLGSSSPLKSLTSPALPTSTKAEPVKVSEPPAVTKPAPFSGFSFFSTPPQSTLGSLGSSAPAPVTSTVQKSNEEEDGEEDDEPPKVEITQVTEDDSVYSTRCKVFGMVDGKYKDKGVGMLYIKKLSGGKHQVVVRADNNLGTVILNILLQKSLPLDKKSAKDVMTIDVHGNNDKGMPILLRVKSEADATELLNKLKEYQEMNNS